MQTWHRGSFHVGWLIVTAGLLTGCGGGRYDSTEVVQGRDWQGEISTVKDGGKPITGTVVKKNAKGEVVGETQYKDGFPTGSVKAWYDNGKPKSESEVVYDEKAKRTHQVGTSRTWCENGTLQSESQSDAEGKAVGKYQTWTCSGKLLSMNTRPYGEHMSAQELENGEVVVTETGTTVAPPEGKNGMFWVGEHKRFNAPDGKPLLVETWVNGQLDGPYETHDFVGDGGESGTYAAGKRVGLWVRTMNGGRLVTDYDPNNFANPQYTGPFMQAAGIDPSGGGATQPGRDYKVDLDKLRYYVSEKLVDPTKKIDLGGGGRSQDGTFSSNWWTYPYVRASTGALGLLVELGADPKAVDSSGNNRLNYCIYSITRPEICSLAEVQRLLGLGLAADQTDKGGDTPLSILIYNANAYWGVTPPETLNAVSKVLLEAGANPDAQNMKGWSPLQNAVLAKRFDTATLLLEHSKNPASTTKEGFNLIQLAFLSQDKQQFYFKLDDATKAFVTLAASKGVNPNQKIEGMGTMKEIAQQSGAIDVAQFLSSLNTTG
jgi:antitoxin component YwqK of YwqJK toxin-antitoxin module